MKKITFSFAAILCVGTLFIYSCGNDDPKPEPQKQAPTVQITNPKSNVSTALSQGTTDSTIAITATANDADGSITKVEFFVDGNKIGEDMASPYSNDFTFTGDVVYVVKVTATDNEGQTTSSSITTFPVLMY